MAMVGDLTDGRYAQDILQERFASLEVGKRQSMLR